MLWDKSRNTVSLQLPPPPPPPLTQNIDITAKINDIVATMSPQQQAKALKLIEILALEFD